MSHHHRADDQLSAKIIFFTFVRRRRRERERPLVHTMMMMMMMPRAVQRGIRSSLVVNRIVAGAGRNDGMTVALRRPFTSTSSGSGRAPLPPLPRVPPPSSPSPPISTTKVLKSSAGTGRMKDAAPGLYARTKDRGPVSWPALFLVTVAAASAVAYYRIERERRLERAMGKVVSSESDGWTPRPDYLAKRKWKATKWGWFPVEDGFGARECYISA